MKIATAKPKSETFIATLGAAVGYRPLKTRLTLLQHATTTRDTPHALRLCATLLTIGGCLLLFSWRPTAVNDPLFRPARYRVEALPQLGEAVALNDRGQVIGRGSDWGDKPSHLLRYEGARLLGYWPQVTDLGLRGNVWHYEVTGMDRRGDIVATGALSEPGSGQETVLVRRGPAWQKLSGLLPDGSSACGVNEAGEIAGNAMLPREPGGSTLVNRAFLYREGAITSIDPLSGGFSTTASAINSRGWIVGTSQGPRGGQSAFLWCNGAMQNLGSGSPSAINTSGRVAGSYPAAGINQACLWQNETRIDLGTPRGRNSQANAINDRGDVVGEMTDASGEARAFLYHAGRITDLNSLISPASEVLVLTRATAINNAGQIVARGLLQELDRSSSMTFKRCLFLLTPQ